MKDASLRFQSVLPHPLQGQSINKASLWNKEEILLKTGECYACWAPSGKGKSTLLNILLGFRKDYTGRVFLGDKDLTHTSLEAYRPLRQQVFSALPQGLRLFPTLNGWDNLAIAAEVTHDAKSKAEIEAMAKALGIANHMNKPCAQWSFGQRQRLAIIRALNRSFQWLLLDEPFSHLDNENAERAWQMITEEAKRHQAGILLTTLHKEDWTTNCTILQL